MEALGCSGARQKHIALQIYVQMKRTAGSDANVLYRSVSLDTDWFSVRILSDASRPDVGLCCSPRLILLLHF